MFDIGFSEIAVVGVVALVVLGPERLPKVARTAGHLFGRLQRYVANVKSDINREMELSELSKLKEEVTSAARSFEQTINEQAKAVENEARVVEKSATEDTITPLPVPAPTQAELIAGQEAGLPPIGTAAQQISAPAAPARAAPPAHAPTASAIQSFDLGVEPPRRHLS